MKKRIAIVLIISMVICNTFIYVNADGFNVESSEITTQTIIDETTIEKSVDENTTEMVVEPLIENIENDEDETMLVEDAESEVIETILTENIESEVIETTLTENIESEVIETILTENIESDDNETTKIITTNNILDTETVATISEMEVTENEIVEDEIIEDEIVEDEIVENEIAATVSELEPTTIAATTVEVAKVSVINNENDNNDIATSSNSEKKYKDGHRDIDYKVKRLKPKYYNRLLREGNLPSSYDSRNVDGISYVPPIRDQNPYGMCWAFSMIGQAEISAIKKGLVSDNNSIDLSEAVLAYYAYNLENITASGSHNIDFPGYEGNDYTMGIYSLDMPTWADLGGNKMLSALLLSSYMGYVKENEETSFDRLKTYKDNIDDYTLDGKYAFNSNDFEVGNIAFINSKDIAAIKKAIIDNGSVGISYYSDERSESIHTVDGEYFYCTEGEVFTSHAIMVIGWDDNISKENFYFGENYDDATYKVEEGDGAWLCRNSWGESYGNNGYFWISYYETSLKNDTFTSTEVISSDTYEYNYHYDTTISPERTNIESRVGNIFKVSDNVNQTLDAVNVAIDDTNVSFDIEIYISDTEMETPINGTKILTQKVNKDLSGVWTIVLDKKVPLKKGTYFSIIINPEQNFSIFVDKEYIPFSRNWFTVVNESKLGQSYIYKDGAFVDYNSYDTSLQSGGVEGRNFRIKGLTNKAGSITFEANGGSGSMSYQVVAYNEETTLDANRFYKEGFEFAGWSGSDGNKYKNKDTIVITEDITLTAIWEKVKRSSGGSSGGGGGNITSGNLPTTVEVGETKIDKNLSVGTSTIVAGNSTWGKDTNGKWHLNIVSETGEIVEMKNQFVAFYDNVNAGGVDIPVFNYYYFDDMGVMLTGWLLDSSGKYYFFDVENDKLGKMVTGWKEISGKYYYFDGYGALVTSGTTPDGFKVNEKGEWVA